VDTAEGVASPGKVWGHRVQEREALFECRDGEGANLEIGGERGVGADYDAD